MAYVTPTTRASGYKVPASVWNSDVVENVKFLHGPPTARLQRDAAQSLASGTWEEISFDTEVWDTDTMWSSTAATKVFARTAGKFLVNVGGFFASSTAGAYRGIGVRKNSTSGNPDEVSIFTSLDPQAGFGDGMLACSGIVSLTTGQYVQMVMLQNTGAGLNTSTVASVQPRLSILWVSS